MKNDLEQEDEIKLAAEEISKKIGRITITIKLHILLEMFLTRSIENQEYWLQSTAQKSQ